MPPSKPDRALPDVALHIGAQALNKGSGGTFEHRNPTTGQVQAQVPLAGPAEIHQAIAAATDAFQSWRRWKPSQRRDVLLTLADLLAAHEAEFTRIAALENGAPVRSGGGRAMLAQQWTRYYAGWADKLEGSVTGAFIRGEDFTYSQPEPYGVIGIIITWNVPLVSLCMKVIPALAAGNCVVVKPSEYTPFTPELFMCLAKEAGIPAGVINTLPGTAEAGNALVAHRHIEKVTFTGGPATARKIMATCAEHLKPSVMELGGKSAYIVFADAALDSAVRDAVSMGLSAMSGQACILGSRVLVQRDIYASFLDKLVAAARQLTCGDPSDPTVSFGPVINGASCERILGMIQCAVEQRAGRLVLGGSRMGDEWANGYFVEPTIFADVDPDADIAQEEVFGPVLCVMPFDNEAHAIALANNTRFGLAAYIHTQDVSRVHRVADQLHAGSVYVNGAFPVPAHSPFGGQGESGFGREGGKAGLDEFIRPKTVAIASLK